MARTRTPRLQLWRWSVSADTQMRSDFDTDNAQLEQLVALAANGTRVARPSPGIRDRLYLALDESILYYDTGSAWVFVTGTGDSGNLTAGSTPAPFTIAPGWGDVATRLVLRGGVLELVVVVERTGATLPVSGSGNLTDTTLLTLVPAYRPRSGTRTMGGFYNSSAPSAGSYGCAGYVNSAGAVAILSGAPSIPVNTGDQINFSDTWLR